MVNIIQIIPLMIIHKSFLDLYALKGFYTNSNAIINSKKVGVKPLLKNIVKL